MTLKKNYLLAPTFFSLTPNEASDYRHNLFTVIHDIVFHGKGGFDWHTVYNMPIWLRNMTMKRISEFYEEQNKQMKSKGKGGRGHTTDDINEARNVLKKAQKQGGSPAQFRDHKGNKKTISIKVPSHVRKMSKK